MSVRVMTLVWEMDLPDSEKIVLLALADCANDEGHCWPGMNALMRKCSKSDRTIQLAIKMLVVKGHLTRREVPGKGCNYTVHPIVKLAGSAGMSHYLYRIERPDTGEFYVGARSCTGRAQNDPYMGSGRWVQSQVASGAALKKTILSEYDSRDELAAAEKSATGQARLDPLCRNAKQATGYLPDTGTPEESAGRRICGAQGTTQTPEAASGKPSRTINTEAKASAKRVIDRWNERSETSGIPAVRVLNNSRMQTLLARIKEHGVEAMLEAVDNVHASEFCRGLKGSGRKADIMLILQPKTLPRVLERFYNQDDAPNAPHQTPEQQITALKRMIEHYSKAGRFDDIREARRRIAELEGGRGPPIIQQAARSVRAA